MNEEEKVKEEVAKCVEVLKAGGVIIYPTDTVWGIGCDATNEAAVDKIFSIKKREESKGLIVLLEAPGKLNKYVKQVPEQAWDLIEYTQKPLTIVYPQAVNLAKNITGNDGTVAIRIVQHKFCGMLINKLGKPITSTSANISGNQVPHNFNDIDPALFSQVDYVVNLPDQAKKTGKPSVIIKLGLSGEIKFVRK